MPLTYHHGQIQVQDEANTRPIAAKLAHWVGPVGDFTMGADLIVLATALANGDLNFVAISGKPPLVQVIGDGEILLPELPLSLSAAGVLSGGIAIDLAQRRRARINGKLMHAPDEESCLLRTSESFVNCRKYIAPSTPLDLSRHVGPSHGEPIGFEDPWLQQLISGAETAFLASMAPDGQPDVSHRGGPPGFLSLDASTGSLSWPEFIGDGMLKSAGNVRATRNLSLLVLDLQTGDAAELSGRGDYKTLNTYKAARESALEINEKPFPRQGEITVQLTRATRLIGLTSPRQREGDAANSASPVEEQSPTSH